MAQRYRKKPSVIEAVRCEYKALGPTLDFVPEEYIALPFEDGLVQVYNFLEDQWLNVPDGHWVIQGLKGEFYPCEAEVFESSYDPEGDDASG